MGKMWSVRFDGLVRPIRRGGRLLPVGAGSFLLRTASATFRVDFRWPVGMWLAASGPPRALGSDLVAARVVWRPAVKKRQARNAEGSQGSHLAAVETETFRDLLPLVEHCCCRKYDDGDPREPGWVTIKTQGAAWCVQVKDPDSCCSFSAVGPTLDKALELAAIMLGCEEAPWEHDKWLASNKGKKK